MKHDTKKQGIPVQTEKHADPGSGSGMLKEARSLWHELRGLSHDWVRLAALETQQAGKSLVEMIAAGMMIGVLLISAWLGLMAAAVHKLAEHGVVATSSALLLAVAASMLLVLILVAVVRRKSRYLQFPATLGSFKAPPSVRGKTEKT